MNAIVVDFYRSKNLWKLILLILAVLIGAGTLFYTETFLKELRQQEVKRVEQFAQALHNILNADPEDNISFELDLIRSNTTIPIILIDEEGELIEARNVDEKKLQNPEHLKRWIENMRDVAEPIEVVFGEENPQSQYLYYRNSTLLTKLRLYPLVLLIVLSVFVVIAYIAFSNARKAEQNQVWNGLAKETAHQIGTPLTSLMGWVEYFRSRGTGEEIMTEMEKDIQRLQTITERFSKIGSRPALHPAPLVEVTRQAVDYLQVRSPAKIKVSFSVAPEVEDDEVALNRPLYEWVIENLIRNAIDAIEGEGYIRVRVRETNRNYCIEVEDSGKGIPAKRQKTIFRPGYTTKNRGWGLGLSLARRIIEDYHGGRIYVAQSEPGKGSLFRILLRKPRK